MAPEQQMSEGDGIDDNSKDGSSNERLKSKTDLTKIKATKCDGTHDMCAFAECINEKIDIDTVSVQVKSNGRSFFCIKWNLLTKLPSQILEHMEPNNAAIGGTDTDSSSFRDDRNCVHDVVIVRGAFGEPFIQALAGCGLVPSSSSICISPTHDDASMGSSSSVGAEKRDRHNQTVNQARRTKGRRPRRRVRPSHVVYDANALPTDKAAAHKDMCNALLSSLSLPALLRVHIVVDGKGTIVTGASLYRYDN
eukprot:3065080-Ditylum_brightwellii.AAC.1